MKKIFLFLSLASTCSCFGQTNATIAEGNRYYSLSEFDLAEASYRKALETDPNNTTMQFNLANALQKQKKYDEAEKLLERLGNSSHDKSFQSAVWYNQGVAYSAQKNLESSIESYKKSLRLNPNDQQ